MTTPSERPRFADPSRCPDCRAELVGTGRCPACALVLEGPDAVRLFRLLSEADGLLARMRAVGAAPAEAGGTAFADGGLAVVDEAAADLQGDRPPVRGVRLPSATVPAVLLGLGAVLLSVAVLVFAAVTWFLLPEIGRALLLLSVAGAATAAAWKVSVRGLRIAAEVLWPLSAFVGVVGLLLLGPDTGDAGSTWTFVCGLVLVGAGLAAARALQGRGLPVPLLLETAVVLLATVAAAGLSDLDPTLPLLGAGSTLCVLALAIVLAVLAARWGLRIVSAIALTAAALAWLSVVGIGAARVADGGFTVLSPARYADLVVAIAIAAAVAYAPIPRGPGIPDAAAPWARRVGAGAGATVLVMLGALATTSYNGSALASQSHFNASALVTSALLLMIATVVRAGRAGGSAPPPRAHRLDGLAVAWALVSVVAALAVVATAASVLDSLGGFYREYGDVADVATRGALVWWWASVVLIAVVVATLPRVLSGSDAASTLARAVNRAVAPSALLLTAALCAVAPRGPLWAVVAVLAAAVSVAAAMAWPTRGVLSLSVLGAAAALLLAAASFSAALLAASSALVAVIAAAMTLTTPRAGAASLPTAGSAWIAAAATAAVTPAAAAAAIGNGLPLAEVGPLAWRLVAIIAAGAWLVLLTVLRHHRGTRLSAGLVGLAVVVVLSAGRPASEISWMLVAAGIATVLATVLDPDDDAPSWVASVLLLGATAARDTAGGPPPEVVSLTAGAALLAIGAWQLSRRPDASSFRLLGPALTLTLLPTLLLALDEPVGVRNLLVAVLATAALAWGALAGLAAPLVIGGGSLLLIGLRLLEPVATALPWWLVAGGLGTLLLVIGATWEARRAEVDAAVRYVRRLR